MEKLEEFLEAEHLKWMVREGKKKSQNDFAKWLGVASGSLSQWMNGMRLPSEENVHLLADKLGPKVYDILGHRRSMPKDERFQKLAEYWYEFNEDQRDKLLYISGEIKSGKL